MDRLYFVTKVIYSKGGPTGGTWRILKSQQTRDYWMTQGPTIDRNGRPLRHPGIFHEIYSIATEHPWASHGRPVGHIYVYQRASHGRPPGEQCKSRLCISTGVNPWATHGSPAGRGRRLIMGRSWLLAYSACPWVALTEYHAHVTTAVQYCSCCLLLMLLLLLLWWLASATGFLSGAEQVRSEVAAAV